MILLDATTVQALLVAGTWENVTSVQVDQLEVQRGATTTTAYGLYLAATVQGGPRNGKRILVPLVQVQGVVTTP